MSMSTTPTNRPYLRSQGDELPPEDVIYGTSPAMRAVRERLEKVAPSSVPVLIHGESGTGKDIFARLIHRQSDSASGPFVKINCPAIPGTLMESEMFGYERGAFTGAALAKSGRVEMADCGTLFLDEISEIDVALQAKLLQLLQDGQFCRIGAQEDKKIEARVICATNRSLQQEVDAGRFRADLFYRINVVSIEIPSLRQRMEDLPIIANYFLDSYREKYNSRAKQISPERMAKLQAYHWPGNIRELENLIRRYVILGSDEALEVEETRKSPSFLGPEISLEGPISLKRVTQSVVRDVEQQIILQVLQKHGWNRKKTARALNISYRALLYKIRDAGLRSPIPEQLEDETQDTSLAANI